MKYKTKSTLFSALAFLIILGGTILAGSLIPTGPVGTPTMYTLSDIYNKLKIPSYTSSPTHTVSTTSSPTTGTMHTLTEIWESIPTINYDNLLDTYSIMGATGTIAVKTNDTAVITTSTSTNKLLLRVPAGYYGGSATISTTSTAFDAGNIKLGVDLFGITGSMSAGTPALEWSSDRGVMTWDAAVAYCANPVNDYTRLPKLGELLNALSQQFIEGGTKGPGSFVD
ncbi:MAG: hypothetical protein NTU76_03600, partial [Candidatus Taylorbacteria bacterium]|nr:hypothetical protein [Candidatus Taylorbacteria bacterium]